MQSSRLLLFTVQAQHKMVCVEFFRLFLNLLENMLPAALAESALTPIHVCYFMALMTWLVMCCYKLLNVLKFKCSKKLFFTF